MKNTGLFLTAYTGGLLLESISKFTVFKITSIFPLTLTFISFLLPESKKVDETKLIEFEEEL